MHTESHGRFRAPLRMAALVVVAALALPASLPAETRWQEFRRRSGNFLGRVWDEVTMLPSVAYNYPRAVGEMIVDGSAGENLVRTGQAVADGARTTYDEAMFLPQWAGNVRGEIGRTYHSGEMGTSFAGFVEGSTDRLTFGGGRVDLLGGYEPPPEFSQSHQGGFQLGQATTDEMLVTALTAGTYRAGRVFSGAPRMSWTPGRGPGPFQRWRQAPDIPEGYLGRGTRQPRRTITTDRQGRPTDGTYTSHVVKNNQHMGFGDNVHGSQFDPGLADVHGDVLRLSQYADEHDLWFRPARNDWATDALVPVSNGGGTQWVGLRRRQSGLVHAFPSVRGPSAQELANMGITPLPWYAPTRTATAGLAGAGGGLMVGGRASEDGLSGSFGGPEISSGSSGESPNWFDSSDEPGRTVWSDDGLLGTGFDVSLGSGTGETPGTRGWSGGLDGVRSPSEGLPRLSTLEGLQRPPLGPGEADF